MCNALRDRGLPTWRDLDNLAPEPTEQELVATLKDPNTAGAVMLITPELPTRRPFSSSRPVGSSNATTLKMAF